MSRYIQYAAAGSLAALLCASALSSPRRPQGPVGRATVVSRAHNSAPTFERQIDPKAPTVSQALSSPAPNSAVQDPPLTASYYQLPLRFEPTAAGAGAAKFLSRGTGYALFLAPTEATLVAERGPSDGPHRVTPVSLHSYASRDQRESIVRFKLRGANPNAAMTGLEEQPGRSNYFIGSDPANWRTNVQQYGKVRIREAYPGVDAIFYGNRRELEYDFLVAPGANPDRIRMQVGGRARARIDARGNAEIETDAGTIVLQKPIVFQEVTGGKRMVPAGFRLARPNEIAFQLGAYDRSRPLVIDPVLSYSVTIGGNDLMEVSGVTVDANGDAYVTGYTCATDFPVSGPNFTTEHNPGGILCHDVIVTKFNALASSLIFSDVIGGSQGDSGTRIAVDSQQNVYVAGVTSSADFPTTTGAPVPSSQFHATNTCNLLSYLLPSPCFDGFALKLSSDGSTLMYSTLLGGTVETFATDIKVNSNGQAYVIGATNSTDFAPAPTSTALQGTYGGGTCVVLNAQTSHRPCFDGFLVILSADGKSSLYSTFLGGADDDDAVALALDPSGNAYVVGGAESTTLTPTTIIPPSSNVTVSQKKAYVAKINFNLAATPITSTLGYLTQLEGEAYQGADSIVVDPATSNAYFTGVTASAHFPTTTGAFQTMFQAATNANNCVGQEQISDIIPNECGNGFVAELNSTGTSLVFSTFLGGTGPDAATGIGLTSTKTIWVTGFSSSATFPTTSDAYYPTPSSGQQFPYLSNLSADGKSMVFSTALGRGGVIGSGGGLAVDSTDSVYVSGLQDTVNTFPETPGVYPFSTNGSSSNFLLKFSTGSQPAIQVTPTSILFPDTPLGTGSSALPVTIHNTSATAASQISLQIAPGVTSNGTAADFLESDNCGASLAANASCTAQVIFEPEAPSPFCTGSCVGSGRSGQLVIETNAPGAPQIVTLGGTTGHGAVFSVSPNPISFPAEPTGQTSQPILVTVASSGDVALNIQSVALSGANGSDFTLIQTGASIPHPCNSPVFVPTYCEVQLTFNPGATGPATRSASLTFTDSAADSPQVIPVSGQATTGATLDVSPTSVFIGPVVIATTPSSNAATTPIVISNPGTTAVPGVTFSFSGSDPGDFGTAASTFNCVPGGPESQPLTVAAGGFCNVILTFSPTSGTHGLRTATFNVNVSPAVNTLPTIAVTGDAVLSTDPSLSVLVVPSPLDFGNVLLGQTSAPASHIMSISNSEPSSCILQAGCGGSLTITTIAPPFADYTVTPETAGCGFPVTIAPSGGCDYQVNFTPGASGPRNGLLMIQSNDPRGTVTVPVAGVGLAIPVVQLSATRLSFGSVAVGAVSPALSVNVTNAGTAALNIASIVPPANFGVNSGSCSTVVPVNGSCTFTVTLTPPAAGFFGGAVTITDNGYGGRQTVQVLGTGAAGPSVFFSPSPLDFGNQTQGSTSAAKTLTITNSGDSALTIAAGGIHAVGEYVLQSTTCPVAPATLAGGASCTASIQFKPVFAVINDAGKLLVTSNAPDSPQGGLLTGNGVIAGSTSSTTTLLPAPNPSTYGQLVTLTATVSGSAGTPTGSVNFSDGSTSVGGSTLNGSGVATFQTSALTGGSHTLSASYSGDATYATSNSSNVSLTVNKAATTAALVSSANPAASGQQVIFTATITGATGAAVPTGTVTFLDGAANIGTGPLDGTGKATLNTSTLSVGSHSITASYPGDANYTSNTTNVFTETVNSGGSTASTTALLAAPNPSTYGQPITLTATVSGSSGTPTGSITFKDGATSLGSGTLNGSGVATLQTAALAGGSHTLTATYGGNATYASSTSSNFSQNVTKAATTALLTSSANPSTSGEQVTFTATVNGIAGAATPTGTVTFSDGGNGIGTGTPDNTGKWTLNVSNLSVAAHSIMAIYAGDTNYTGSTTNTVTQTVNPAPDFTISAAPTSQTVTHAAPNTSFMVTLTPQNVSTAETVTLACSSSPTLQYGTCSPASSPATLNGTTASSVQINVTTTPNTAIVPPASGTPSILLWVAATLCFLAGLLLLSGRTRRKAAGWVLATCILAVVLYVAGCNSNSYSNGGGNGTHGTPAGSYTLTLTGTSGTTNHQTTVTLTVSSQ